MVGNVSTDSSTCVSAQWPSGTSVLLQPGRYLVDFESNKSVTSGTYSYQQSKMVLMHNKSQENAKTFTFEYLEPYQNGSCHLYFNCLHCLTDSLCGWCDLTNACLPRSLNESQVLKVIIENSFLWCRDITCLGYSSAGWKAPMTGIT